MSGCSFILESILNFLLDLHRSVFDASFYKEIDERSKGKVLKYFLLLCLLTSVLAGGAKVYYFLDRDKGIVRPLTSLLKGMEIKDGKLDPKLQTPYIPPKHISLMFIERLIENSSSIVNRVGDTLVVIDTTPKAAMSEKGPLMLFRHNDIVFWAGGGLDIKIPYKKILGNEYLYIEENSVYKFLRQNFLPLFFIAFLNQYFEMMVIVFLSSLFLAVAAFMFRYEKNQPFGRFLKIALFASTPIAYGIMVIALSGAVVPWMWHLLIFLSTIVMFRGVMTANKSNSTPQENNGE